MTPCARCGDVLVAGEREAMPVCPACEVPILTELLSCVQAEHSLDKAALDSAAEQLAIYAVNTTALMRERDELLVKLQAAERSYDKLRLRYEDLVREIPAGHNHD